MLALSKFHTIIVQNMFKNTCMGVTCNKNSKERGGIENDMIMHGSKDIRYSILDGIGKKYVDYHLMEDVMIFFNYHPH